MIDHERRHAANQEAFARLTGAEPTLVDVLPAGEVVPGYTPTTILTSGPPLPWEEYEGGQRNAIAYGAMFEGLAGSVEEADRKIAAGEITIGACHHYGCVGSVAGIYTASMPVFVVDNPTAGQPGLLQLLRGGVAEAAQLRRLRRRRRRPAPLRPRAGGAGDQGGGAPLRRDPAQAADGAGAPPRRRTAQPEHRRHPALHPRARPPSGRDGRRRRRRRAGHAPLPRRERLLLPPGLDGGGQGGDRRRPQRRGLEHGGGDEHLL